MREICVSDDEENGLRKGHDQIYPFKAPLRFLQAW